MGSLSFLVQGGSEDVLDKLLEAADGFCPLRCVRRPRLLFQRCAVVFAGSVGDDSKGQRGSTPLQVRLGKRLMQNRELPSLLTFFTGVESAAVSRSAMSRTLLYPPVHLKGLKIQLDAYRVMLNGCRRV